MYEFTNGEACDVMNELAGTLDSIMCAIHKRQLRTVEGAISSAAKVEAILQLQKLADAVQRQTEKQLRRIDPITSRD